MRLKKLVLHGFKSFADRTEFKFDQSVTCVVGPNGCGKSNVVDAIKWVLGEQSAKSLRGGAMLDVIFNGAESRKAAGMAEVELVFENPRRKTESGEGGDRYLTVDTEEVSVMRRLWRDGTSEYLINQQGGRLKDIKELFLDTGVGVDAYSIIEQGRVARLLEANPVERRQIFEEAAGISRFKVRKKEAQRKLEKVDDNLARLGDITKELESRLRSVKIQAGRARTYQELAQRLSELRLQHALHDYHTLRNRLEKLTAKQADARFRFDDAEGNLEHRSTELSDERHKADQLGQSKQNTSHDLIQTKSRIAQADQQTQYATRQLEQFEEQMGQITHDRETMSSRLEEVIAHFDEAKASLQQFTDEVAAHRTQIESRQEAHRTAQLRHNEVNKTLDEHKSAYLDAMRKLAQVDSRLQSIEIERKSVAAQEEKLTVRAGALTQEASEIDARKSELLESIGQVLAQIEEQQTLSNERSGEAKNLGSAIKQLTERLGSAREHRSGLMSRQKMLQDLEARREGISDAVQRVLKQRETRFPFIRGLVADLLRVDVEHAHVIEAALDGRDQWLVADPSVDLLQSRDAFEELSGRVNLLRVTREQVLEHLPATEQREVIEEQQANMCVIAQSELWEVETDQAVSMADDTSIRFIPTGNVPQTPINESRIINVTGKLIDTLASSTRMDGSPIAVTVGSSEDNFVDPEDEAYDWNQHEQFVRLAIDLVRFEPQDRVIALRLLGKTVVVDTLTDAMTLHREAPKGWRYVTKAGEVMESDGTYRVGPLGASMGILSRRSELEAVTHQISDVDGRIAALGEELAQGNEQARSLESAIAAIRQEIYRLNTNKVEITSKIQQADSRLEALLRERPIIDREIAQMAGSLTKLEEESTRLAEQKSTLAQKQADHQTQIDALTGEQQQLVEQLRHAAEELTAARILVGQLEEKQYAARQSVQRLEAQRGEFTQQLDRLTKAVETISQKRVQIERDLQSAKHQRETLESSVGELQARLEELEASFAEAQRHVSTLSTEVDSLRAEKAAVEQELHKLEVDLSEVNVRTESLVQRTQEEIQIDLVAKYDEVQSGTVAPLVTEENTSEALVPQEAKPEVLAIDWDAIAEEIKQLKERISRLGNVNLDAINELDELEKRQTEYTTQVADLASSKQQLEALIDQINADSSVRFEQTFQAVREHFQLMFRKLFGGGKADIILETEFEDKKAALAEGADPTSGPIMRRVDPLDAGIEVIARPPGKNPVTLSQLSGGEKAMTCIALLMSIFKAKPSPFCILDEVDAPLDEANNQRFTQIVQEFLSISQFIIITHHKKTMQIADMLYGVTQQTHGVSTRVPVKFDQVDNGGRIKDEAIAAA
jgi:chromosome segregation protein